MTARRQQKFKKPDWVAEAASGETREEGSENVWLPSKSTYPLSSIFKS